MNRYRGSGARSIYALLATYHATLEREAPPYRLESRGRSVAYHPSSFAHAFLRAVSNENERGTRSGGEFEKDTRAGAYDGKGGGGWETERERRIVCVSDTLRSCAFETSDASCPSPRCFSTERNLVSFATIRRSSLPFPQFKGNGIRVMVVLVVVVVIVVIRVTSDRRYALLSTEREKCAYEVTVENAMS